jgi:hypothetical protein
MSAGRLAKGPARRHPFHLSCSAVPPQRCNRHQLRCLNLGLQLIAVCGSWLGGMVYWQAIVSLAAALAWVAFAVHCQRPEDVRRPPTHEGCCGACCFAVPAAAQMFACQAPRVDLNAMVFNEELGSRLTEYVVDPQQGTAHLRRVSGTLLITLLVTPCIDWQPVNGSLAWVLWISAVPAGPLRH